MKGQEPKGLPSTRSPQPRKRVPWWATVLLAIGCYSALKYAVPHLSPANPVLQQLIHAAPVFAPLVTIFFLLLAAKQLYDTDLGKKESDRTDDKDEGAPSA